MKGMLLVCCILGSAVTMGADLRRAEETKPINQRCPVGKEQTDGRVVTTYKGNKISLCCPGCERPFHAWSEARKDAFVKACTEKSEPAPGKPPAEGPNPAPSGSDPYPLTVCVVSGGTLGSMGDPVVREYDGWEVRFCCAGCVPRFEADREKFAEVHAARIVEDQGRFYPLSTGIVSEKPLVVGKARDVVVGNRLFRVTDLASEEKLKESPAPFVKKLEAATKASQRSEYPLEHCVVAGGKLGSMGEPTELVVGGRLLRFCCSSCEPRVKANPLPFLAEVDEAWRVRKKYLAPTTRPATRSRGQR